MFYTAKELGLVQVFLNVFLFFSDAKKTKKHFKQQNYFKITFFRKMHQNGVCLTP